MCTGWSRCARPDGSAAPQHGLDVARRDPSSIRRRADASIGRVIQIRPATRGDVAAMVALAAARRERLERYQPQFWRRRAGAERVQAAFFEHLLGQDDTYILVAAHPDGLVGFVIARLEQAPPVYDPGGPSCAIDDFGADNVTTARELLVGVRRWAAKRGATQLVVIAAHGDRATRTVLEDEGMTLASEWWVQPLQ